MEQQLLTYIEQELKRGVAEQMIKRALGDAGWESALIEEAFAVIQPPAASAVSGDGKKDEKQSGAPAGIPEQTAKTKLKKTLIVAGIVFGAAAMIFILLIVYFSWSATSKLSVDNAVPIEVAETTTKNAEAPVMETETEESATSEVLQISTTTVPVVAASTTTATVIVPATTTAAVATTTESLSDAATRDARRMADMKQLVSAQETWFGENNKYYTCGLSGGDCKGKAYGFPAQIGLMTQTPQDPLAAQYASTKKAICGTGYVYCGLNNAPYSQFFCYYAHLEGGGYYTASHAGNFKRSSVPKVFEDCAVAN